MTNTHKQLASTAPLGKVDTVEQAASNRLTPTDNSITRIAKEPSCAVEANTKVELLIDRVSYKDKAKPNSSEMGMIRNRLSQNNSYATTTIEGLEEVIKSGYTMMPAICRGGTKKENWRAQQLFFLDFDNDEEIKKRGLNIIEPLEAVSRAFDNKLDPLYLYFSHNASIEPYHPRFRMIFSLSAPSMDLTYVEKVGRGLIELYPEADPASIRPTQMFLSPGKEVWPCWKVL